MIPLRGTNPPGVGYQARLYGANWMIEMIDPIPRPTPNTVNIQTTNALPKAIWNIALMRGTVPAGGTMSPDDDRYLKSRMETKLTFKYDREGDILHIDNCRPYAEQESTELPDEVA